MEMIKSAAVKQHNFAAICLGLCVSLSYGIRNIIGSINGGLLFLNTTALPRRDTLRSVNLLSLLFRRRCAR